MPQNTHIQKLAYFALRASGLWTSSLIFKFFKPANKDSSVVIFLGDEAFNGFVFSGIEAQFPPVIVDGSPQAERGKKNND